MGEQTDTALTAMGAHVSAMEKRLGHWGSELEKLGHKAQSARIDEKAALDKRLVSLRAQFEHAQERLSLLRDAGEKKWEAFKADLEVAVRDFEKALKGDR